MRADLRVGRGGVISSSYFDSKEKLILLGIDVECEIFFKQDFTGVPSGRRRLRFFNGVRNSAGTTVDDETRQRQKLPARFFRRCQRCNLLIKMSVLSFEKALTDNLQTFVTTYSENDGCSGTC